MKTNPSAIAVTASLLFDSFDYVVLFLVVSAGIFLLWKRSRAWLFPLVFSGLLTLGVWKAIPAWVIPGNIAFFCILWVPAIFISFVSYGIESRKEKPKDVNCLGAQIVKILICLIFFLVNYHIYSRAGKVDFFVLNNYSLAAILFLGITMLQPARFLPPVVFKETCKFCLYLALGLFLLRGGFWTYTAFNASISEPPGSFLPRGVMFAKEWSEVWQFHHLEMLIDKYWLYKPMTVKPETPKEEAGNESATSN